MRYRQYGTNRQFEKTDLPLDFLSSRKMTQTLIENEIDYLENFIGILMSSVLYANMSANTSVDLVMQHS